MMDTVKRNCPVSTITLFIDQEHFQQPSHAFKPEKVSKIDRKEDLG